ncbi:MAG TPA: hypothetical protein VFF59_10370, partial [Anaerolineae bacterium]|nr:hypothetical protein [Anaerolineae bacterium]
EQETVVKTQPRSPSRWRKFLLGAILIAGMGLGAAYSAIPAPPRPGVPTPQPTALPPPPLDPIINRESHALASGDEATFMALQDQVDGEWYRAQQAAFKPWGTPQGDRLYTILEQGYSSDRRAWAEVTQWINNDVYVRETRFYQLRDGASGRDWQRARPDSAFWSGTEWTGRSTHFDLTYPAEDNRLAWRVTQRFERVYDVLCRDLNCPGSRRTPRFNLIFDPDRSAPLIESGDSVTITLPSPRLLEFHEPYGTADDAVTTLAYRILLDPIMRQASGDAARWDNHRAGGLILQGLMAWETLRIQLARVTPPEQTFINAPGELWRGPSQGEPSATQQFYRDLLRDAKLIPLADLWHWSSDMQIPNDQYDVIDGEIDSLIAFIEDKRGPAGVVDFLNALGPARSLDQAIGPALSTTYAEFEQQWQRWIDQ